MSNNGYGKTGTKAQHQENGLIKVLKPRMAEDNIVRLSETKMIDLSSITAVKMLKKSEIWKIEKMVGQYQWYSIICNSFTLEGKLQHIQPKSLFSLISTCLLKGSSLDSSPKDWVSIKFYYDQSVYFSRIICISEVINYNIKEE